MDSWISDCSIQVALLNGKDWKTYISKEFVEKLPPATETRIQVMDNMQNEKRKRNESQENSQNVNNNTEEELRKKLFARFTFLPI